MPIAPFFRFTGLADSAALLGYLQTRGIATFTVDAVSNDSYITDEQRLIDHTLKEISDAKGGIILFHDIKPATARALPKILTALKARGYSVVHMTSKGAAVPLSPLMSELAPKVANAPRAASAKDKPLAPDDSRVIAVAADIADAHRGHLPVFQLDDIAGLADFISTHLGLQQPR